MRYDLDKMSALAPKQSPCIFSPELPLFQSETGAQKLIRAEIRVVSYSVSSSLCPENQS